MGGGSLDTVCWRGLESARLVGAHSTRSLDREGRKAWTTRLVLFARGMYDSMATRGFLYSGTQDLSRIWIGPPRHECDSGLVWRLGVMAYWFDAQESLYFSRTHHTLKFIYFVGCWILPGSYPVSAKIHSLARTQGEKTETQTEMLAQTRCDRSHWTDSGVRRACTTPRPQKEQHATKSPRKPAQAPSKKT